MRRKVETINAKTNEHKPFKRQLAGVDSTARGELPSANRNARMGCACHAGMEFIVKYRKLPGT